MLKIRGKRPLPKLSLGSAKTLSISEDVFVVGSHYNNVFSIHKGIVNKIDQNEKIGLIEVIVPLIKGFLARGGALVNIKGEVVGIIKVRKGEVDIKPGYDGEYGRVKIFSEKEKKKQMSLF